jgi:hypothetical protein
MTLMQRLARAGHPVQVPSRPVATPGRPAEAPPQREPAWIVRARERGLPAKELVS